MNDQKVVDLTTVLTKEHERKWVALSKDSARVIACDDDLVRLDQRVAGEEVIFMKVPSSDTFLSF